MISPVEDDVAWAAAITTMAFLIWLLLRRCRADDAARWQRIVQMHGRLATIQEHDERPRSTRYDNP